MVGPDLREGSTPRCLPDTHLPPSSVHRCWSADRTFRWDERLLMAASEDTRDRRLDGNAAAGPLAELFAVELTAAVVTCAGCSNSAPLAAYDLYADAPALVLRCP